MSKITIDRAVVEQALEDICGAKLCEINSMSSRHEMLRLMEKSAAALRAALGQPVEQEPAAGVIGWKNHIPNSGTVVHWTALMPPLGTKLYAHPQPRQPLTPEAVNDLWIKHARSGAYIHAFAQAIERAHGIGGEA